MVWIKVLELTTITLSEKVKSGHLACFNCRNSNLVKTSAAKNDKWDGGGYVCGCGTIK